MAATKAPWRPVADILADIRQAAEKHRRDLPITLDNMSVGDAAAQGDVALEYIGETLKRAEKHLGLEPGSLKVSKAQSAQLAPGNTKGSRHIIHDMTGITLYELPNATPIDGPVILLSAECGDGMVLTHPQHPWHTYTQPGFYAVHYQRTAAEELKRRLD